MASSENKGLRYSAATLGIIVSVLLLIGGYAWYKSHQATKPGPAGQEALKNIANAADAVADVQQLNVRIKRITRAQLTADFSARIRNKLPVGVTLDSVRYVVALDGDSLVRGLSKERQRLEASGVSTLRVPFSAAFQPLLKKVLALQRDSATLGVRAIVYPDLPVARKGIPIKIEQRVRIPKLPHIGVARVKLNGLGKNRQVLVTLRITNYESLPLRFETLQYRFRLDPDGDDVDVYVRGHQATPLSLAKPGDQLVTVPVALREVKVGKAAWKFIAKAKKTQWRVEGTMHAALTNQINGAFDMDFAADGNLADAKAMLKDAKNKK